MIQKLKKTTEKFKAKKSKWIRIYHDLYYVFLFFYHVEEGR